jgi:DNA-binding transcriptional regulator YiaG
VSESALLVNVENVINDVGLLMRVLGVPQSEILERALEAGVDAILADPEVDDLVRRLHALDARRKGAPIPAPAPEPVPQAVQRPASPAKSVMPPVSSAEDGGDHEPEATQRPLTLQERKSAAILVRETRMKKNLSQVQLATELGTSGATISNVERADTATSSAAVRAALAWAKKNT